jgi:hypothetical protein
MWLTMCCAAAQVVVKGEHPIRVDARIDRAGVEELFPLWSVAWDVDLEQSLPELRFRAALDVEGNGATVDGDREFLSRQVGGADLRWRKRTESGAEPKWKEPRKKMPSTGPTIGRPSAVTVARASRRIPVSRSATSSAVSRRSGVTMLRRCRPAVA